MMRAGMLVIPFLLLAVLAGMVSEELPAETGLPAGAQVQLNRYVSLSGLPGTTRVVSFDRARRPWKLPEGLNVGLLGDSSHFRSSASLTGTMPADRPMLRHPPREAWCVLVAGTAVPAAGKPARNEVLVLGLHLDMYVGEWIVHRPSAPPDTQAHAELLTLIGCEPPSEGSR